MNSSEVAASLIDVCRATGIGEKQPIGRAPNRPLGACSIQRPDLILAAEQLMIAAISLPGHHESVTTTPTVIGGSYGAGVLAVAKAHVATYVAGLDLADFDPKAPPPKTQVFWEMADSARWSSACLAVRLTRP
jgi:hypothetical protein